MTNTPPEASSLRQKFGLQKRTSSLRLSSRTLDAYKEAFNAIDRRRTGRIDRKELEVVLGKLGKFGYNNDNVILQDRSLQKKNLG